MFGSQENFGEENKIQIFNFRFPVFDVQKKERSTQLIPYNHLAQLDYHFQFLEDQ